MFFHGAMDDAGSLVPPVAGNCGTNGTWIGGLLYKSEARDTYSPSKSGHFLVVHLHLPYTTWKGRLDRYRVQGGRGARAVGRMPAHWPEQVEGKD
jgi:hypothetical protein